MARKPRIHFSGALYHVMLRGNDGQSIFFDADDRVRFNELVYEGVNRYNHVVYSFCWMSNHVHFAIEVDNIPLSKIIQNLAFRYTRYINKKMKRIGHLFQGRYKAILVQKDSYLLELVRYIHLNPIRARIVENIEDYVYSSHLCYLNKAQIPWVNSQKVLSMFSNKRSIAVKEYNHFIYAGRTEAGIDFKKGKVDPRVLGDDEYVNEINYLDNEDEMQCSIDLISSIVCDVLSVSNTDIKQKTKRREISEAKHIIGYINKHFGLMTNRELSQLLRLEPSALSRAITNIEIRNEQNIMIKIGNIISACRKSITQA